MNLTEIGERLRQERIDQGLTIEHVVEKTKISRRNLRAIEDGDTSDLPHAVYAKGFVRNYAGFLGVHDPEIDEALNHIFPEDNEAFDPETMQEIKRSMRAAAAASRPKGQRSPIGFIAFGGVLVLLGIIIWLMFFTSAEQLPFMGETTDQQPVAEVSSPDPEVSDPPATLSPIQPERAEPGLPEPRVEPVTPQADDLATPNDSATPEDSSTQATQPSQQQAPQGPTAEATEPEPAPTPEETAAPVPAPQPDVITGGTVRIVAREPCWMEVTPEGNATLTREYFLRTGEDLVLNYEERLQVRLGNGGGVVVFHNGERLSYTAQSGQVKTLLFP